MRAIFTRSTPTSLRLLATLMLLAATGPAGTAVAQTKPLPAIAPAAEGFDAQRLTRLDAVMSGLVSDGHVPGISTMLIRDGKIVSVRTHGVSSLESRAPLKRDTLFRIYSQTKPVTAIAMMILFEEGRWQLEDPISKHVPELADLRVFKSVNADGSFVTEPARRSPTMREIMTHTAGFAYGLSTEHPVDKAYRTSVLGSRSGADFIQRVAALPLVTQPGTEWRYSIGMDLQGYIVERMSGKPLPQFMQERIFGPLGMTDTGFMVAPEKRARLASLYFMQPLTHKLVAADGFMVLDISQQPKAASGGGGLVSTLDDYARLAQMLANGGDLDGVRLLAPSTVRLMMSNHLPESIRDDAALARGFGQANGMGFGLNGSVVLDSARAGIMAGEGTYSWGGAAGTWFWVDPQNRLVFLGMMHVLARQSNPALRDLDSLSQTLVYQALTNPAR